MKYIDGFVAAVPQENKQKFIEHVKEASLLIKSYGASRVVECWGDDVPEGKITSMPMAVKCEQNEVVVFSWIEWPDKVTRDKGMKAMMEDERMANIDMPFDAKRCIFGGFAPVLDESF